MKIHPTISYYEISLKNEKKKKNRVKEDVVFLEAIRKNGEGENCKSVF